MSGPRKPWGKRVWEILQDGQIHKLGDLVAEAGPLVPPGQAYRAGLSKKNNRPRELIVLAGRRNVILNFLRNKPESQLRLWKEGGDYVCQMVGVQKPDHTKEIKKLFGEILQRMDKIGNLLDD